MTVYRQYSIYEDSASLSNLNIKIYQYTGTVRYDCNSDLLRRPRAILIEIQEQVGRYG